MRALLLMCLLIALGGCATGGVTNDGGDAEGGKVNINLNVQPGTMARPAAAWRQGPCMHTGPCGHFNAYGYPVHAYDQMHLFDWYPPGY